MVDGDTQEKDEKDEKDEKETVLTVLGVRKGLRRGWFFVGRKERRMLLPGLLDMGANVSCAHEKVIRELGITINETRAKVRQAGSNWDCSGPDLCTGPQEEERIESVHAV